MIPTPDPNVAEQQIFFSRTSFELVLAVSPTILMVQGIHLPREGGVKGRTASIDTPVIPTGRRPPPLVYCFLFPLGHNLENSQA